MNFSFYDPAGYIIGLLMALGGCFHPPVPIEIVTPKSVTFSNVHGPSEKEFYLTFGLNAENRLHYVTKEMGRRSGQMEIHPITKAEIENELTEIMKEVKYQNKELIIRIHMDPRVHKENFTILTQALRTKGLIKYKLITTPE